VMPLVFLLLYKLQSNFKKLSGLILLFVISALLSYILTKYNQKIAYYLVVSRAFEFLVGAILAFLILNYRQKLNVNLLVNHVLTFASLILLVLSAIIIDEKVPFPSLVALVPCLATALLIFTGLDNRSVTYKILGSPLLVFVGKISYSLYLWHWPLVAYCKYVGVEFTYVVQLSIAISSVVLAFLSWKYIEQPVRHIKGQNITKFALALYVFPFVLVTVFYYIGKNYEFFPKRFDSTIIEMEASIKSKPEYGRENCHTSNVEITTNSKCFLGDITASKVDVILWGDSHANHFVGLMDELGKHSSIKIQDITMGNCPPLIDIYVNLPKSRNNCIEKNNNVLSFIQASKPKYVFIAASWGGYSEGTFTDYPSQKSIDVMQNNLINTIEELQKMNIKVVIFKMLPRMKKDLSSCSTKMTRFPNLHKKNECEFDNDFKVNKLDEFYENINELTSYKVGFVDVSKFYCQNKRCNTWIDSTPLYRDNNHLNMKGSELLGRLLASSNQITF
ncbi:MAG: acyltransferase, partial [Colwelliaceae bacterium]|nr:acyltransferase [Colwelliaceae bacterium]